MVTRRARRLRDGLAMLAVLIAAATFLFAAHRPLPILLWDESRNIVNAMEMKRAGIGLVTTYGGQPDLWNTKPPLLIWLMVGSATLFGTSEWALRLPSMLATLGTLLVVMMFVRRATGSMGTAAVAAFFLAASPALFGEHGARTADYDALLLFFVTSYLALLFFALHRGRPGLGATAVIAGMIAGAILTKSVAGVVPGVGVGLYLILTRRLPRLWRSPDYAVAAIAIIVAIAALTAAREAAAPGYVAAAWHNDIAGRFARSIIGNPKSPDHYIRLLLAGYFSAAPLLLISPLALIRLRGRSRLALIYALCISGVMLAVISAAASKLDHYMTPALPFMAIAAAITLRAILSGLAGIRRDSLSRKLIAAGLVVAAVLPLVFAVESAIGRRYFRLLHSEFEERQALYGRLLPILARAGTAPIVIVDPGFVLEREAHYKPILRVHELIAAERGMTVHDETDLDGAKRWHQGIIASCDAVMAPNLAAWRRDIGGVPGCTAVAAN